jgi:dolichol-phosphate mannosyltransferase
MRNIRPSAPAGGTAGQAMDISIVIPCYNEIDSIAHKPSELLAVAEQLAETQAVEVIFVDDGSTDGTAAALQAACGGWAGRAAARLVCHPSNRGLGAALRTGFAAARGSVVVTSDSDGTYQFSEIPALLMRLAPGIDIVTASPYHPDGVAGVTPLRLVLSQGSSFLYRLLVNRSVHTYTSLFRAYRRHVIDHVPFEADGFLAGTELMVKSMLAGCRVAEHPAVLHARSHGQSKARLLRTIAAHLKFQGRVLLHRLALRRMIGPFTQPGGQLWAPSNFSSTGEHGR